MENTLQYICLIELKRNFMNEGFNFKVKDSLFCLNLTGSMRK